MALTDKPFQWYTEGMEERMEIIGQNGNEGLHYDTVENPSHYTEGDIECIDAIQSALTDTEFRGYCKGNAIKYVWREGRKGDGNEDLKKAIWYLKRATEVS